MRARTKIQSGDEVDIGENGDDVGEKSNPNEESEDRREAEAADSEHQDEKNKGKVSDRISHYLRWWRRQNGARCRKKSPSCDCRRVRFQFGRRRGPDDFVDAG